MEYKSLTYHRLHRFFHGRVLFFHVLNIKYNSDKYKINFCFVEMDDEIAHLNNPVSESRDCCKDDRTHRHDVRAIHEQYYS